MAFAVLNKGVPYRSASGSTWTANVDQNGFSITDGGGLEILSFTEVASAVNELDISNNSTGNPVIVSTTGGDTNISLSIEPKGTGQVLLHDGALATPSLAAKDNPTSGFYFIGDLIVYAHGNSLAETMVQGAGFLRPSQDGNFELGITSTRWEHVWTFALTTTNAVNIGGALNHDGSTVGFYGTAPIAQQTGVAVTAAGIHAACVALGLFTA